MAIDLSEELIPLTQIPAQPFVPRRRRGTRLNVATVFRWANAGVRGIRLETIRFGGTLCTTRSALLEFFRRLTRQASDESVSPPPRTPRPRALAGEKAARELEKAGI
jgi:hypothetical protein